METKIVCNSCGQHVMIDDAAAGQNFACPNCGQNIAIPSVPAAAASPASARSAGGDTGLDRAFAQLQSVLVDGETVQAWAVQRRMFALNHRRVLVAATSGRFIALERKLFGGFDMTDFRWQDLRDAKVKAGVFGADLSFDASGTSDLATAGSGPRAYTYTGLRKEQAEQVYRIAQAQDQAWREKRRIRDLEEMRARAGGVQLTSSPPPIGSTTALAGDAAARLQQARQMLDAKLISDSEYEALKARIIDGV